MIVNLKIKSLRNTEIFGAVLAGVLLWAYFPIIDNLVSQLLKEEDFTFGLMMPLISGYIAYQKWPQIRVCSKRPTWMGLLVLAVGLILFIFGEVSTDLYIPRLSLVVSIIGVILLIGGWQITRVLWFPIILLVVMMPLPQFIMSQLTLPLQMISSRLAFEILQLLGISVVLQGNIINLGVRHLLVVEACSGFRYILPLMQMGLIYCYFYQARFWKAAILLLTLIPAAIIANALRVAAMGIFSVLEQGFWHAFSGWLIYVFCLGFLMLLNKILGFHEPQAIEEVCLPSPRGEIAGGSSRYPVYLIFAIFTVIIAGFFAQTVGNIPPMPLRQSFDNFPLQLGPWEGNRSYIDPKMFAATGASTYLNVDFRDAKQEPVALWIAYYENQKAHGSVHSPFTCLVGGGWKLIETGRSELSPSLPIRYMVIEQGGVKYLLYYWYLQRGRWLTSEYLNKFFLSYDGLFSRRADGALIRLVTPINSDLTSAQERLTIFAKLLVPVLPQFMQK